VLWDLWEPAAARLTGGLLSLMLLSLLCSHSHDHDHDCSGPGCSHESHSHAHAADLKHDDKVRAWGCTFQLVIDACAGRSRLLASCLCYLCLPSVSSWHEQHMHMPLHLLTQVSSVSFLLDGDMDLDKVRQGGRDHSRRLPAEEWESAHGSASCC
jgi:hypothetical protein